MEWCGCGRQTPGMRDVHATYDPTSNTTAQAPATLAAGDGVDLGHHIRRDLNRLDGLRQGFLVRVRQREVLQRPRDVSELLLRRYKPRERLSEGAGHRAGGKGTGQQAFTPCARRPQAPREWVAMSTKHLQPGIHITAGAQNTESEIGGVGGGSHDHELGLDELDDPQRRAEEEGVALHEEMIPEHRRQLQRHRP